MDGGIGGVDDRRWRASPLLAASIRWSAIALPLVVAALVLWAVSGVLWHPAGAIGTVVWIAQVAGVVLVVAAVVDRFSRRALPLAALYDLSLVFPGPAPSRLAMAARVATPARRRRCIGEVLEHGLGDDPAVAAPTALEVVLALAGRERLPRDHTARVRHWADLLACEMGLSDAERDQLAWGVILHDIGKIAIPREILDKVGRPTDDEWVVLRRHPTLGMELLAPLADWLGEWASAAGQHHERWDGTGYPARLAGEQISLAGRITAVADAFAVITARSSYSRGLVHDGARQEMLRCAGTQFDPAVVRALLALPADDR